MRQQTATANRIHAIADQLFPGGLDLILDEIHPIGMWRRVLKELHGIHLPERP